MNQKGQALVEFILVLPVILLTIIALIDIGNIFLEKYKLNNCLETATELYQNNQEKELKAYIAKEEIIYSETEQNDLVTITLSKSISINAPFLNKALGKTHTIKTSKTIYKKKDENE